MSITSQAVLVLNASYQPYQVTNVRNAVNLILAEKAEMVEQTGAFLRSPSTLFPVPLIIRLLRYSKLPRRRRVPLTRHTIMMRDGYRCQYCGAILPREKLTIDHVFPRARGGTRQWENIVTACVPCNRRKRDRTPHEANMKLLSTPREPRYAGPIWAVDNPPDAWAKYLTPMR